MNDKKPSWTAAHRIRDHTKPYESYIPRSVMNYSKVR